MLRYKKNPGRKSSVIEVDGRQYKAKYVGRGQYSRVFRVGDRVIYYTRGDCGKEVLAMYLYDRMAHLPDLTRHENITTSRGTWWVFSSPYYRNVTKKDRSAWEMMRDIVKWANYYHSKGYQIGKRDINLIDYVVEGMASLNFPYSIINALYEIRNAASNCGIGSEV